MAMIPAPIANADIRVAERRTRGSSSALLRERHHIRAGADDDFNLRNPIEIAEAVEQSTQTMEVVLAAIASVSLLVGGIGIMNIMLVSATERTREIGLRLGLAPGATMCSASPSWRR